MIKHTVCYKLKDRSEENCLETQRVLLSMQGRVPQVLKVEAGIDYLHSERSYDIILQIWFENEQAFNDYQKDPYHCSVVKPHMHAVRETSVAVDCFVD